MSAEASPIESDEHAVVRFKCIDNYEEFYQPNAHNDNKAFEHFINVARTIIDNTDPNICDFLANFNMHASAQKLPELSQPVLNKLDGTPEEFLIALVKYIDFHDLSDELVEKNIVTLAGFVAQRFSAISLVAHGKKLNGETDPFHPARHENVLNARASSISIHGLDKTLCRKIFGDFMEAGCKIQKDYMTNEEPSTQPMAARLKKLGVHHK